MQIADLIAKKRDGATLSQAEIKFLIEGYTNNQIPDYQMAAWAMAVFFQGLNKEETMNLTQAMIDSGERVDLSLIKGTIVDKHSTGGVGDTTTVILAPLIAAAGIPVAKMSGRGLGYTGGTIDKLEAIPGMNLELGIQAFTEQVNQIGIGIVGQTGNLVPADKKLYALRDVTGTVASLPLIAASIMSKKIASGAHAIVLDVKTGKGAFMKTREDSFELAKVMVNIGHSLGHPTVAVISDMNEPLGYAVGNSLEIKEAIDTLKGKGPPDLKELCLTLGAELLVLSGQVNGTKEARQILENLLASGKALDKFAELIQAQGGNPGVIKDYDLLPTASIVLPVISKETGYVGLIDCQDIGQIAMGLGAGRTTKDDQIDLGVGIVLCKKIGETVKKDELLAYVHASNREKGIRAVEQIIQAYQIMPKAPPKNPLIHGMLKGSDN